jgi:hypothetical protein
MYTNSIQWSQALLINRWGDGPYPTRAQCGLEASWTLRSPLQWTGNLTSSASAHHSPLLDMGLSYFSPSRSIFGYSYPTPANHPAQSTLHLAWGRRTLRLPRRGLHARTRLLQRLSVLRMIRPAHCHSSMLIRCAISVTLVHHQLIIV